MARETPPASLKVLKQAVAELSGGWDLLVCSPNQRLIATAALLLEPLPFRRLSSAEWISGASLTARPALLLCDDLSPEGGAQGLLTAQRHNRTHPPIRQVLVGLDERVSDERLRCLWQCAPQGLICSQRTGEGQLLQAMACLLRGNSWLDPGFAARLQQHSEDGAELTDREQELLRMLAAGRTTQEMAALLQVRCDTIRRRFSGLYAKTGSRGQRDLLSWGLEQGVLRSGDLLRSAEPCLQASR